MFTNKSIALFSEIVRVHVYCVLDTVQYSCQWYSDQERQKCLELWEKQKKLHIKDSFLFVGCHLGKGGRIFCAPNISALHPPFTSTLCSTHEYHLNIFGIFLEYFWNIFGIFVKCLRVREDCTIYLFAQTIEIGFFLLLFLNLKSG